MGRVTTSVFVRLRRLSAVAVLLAVVWLPSPLSLCSGDPGGPGCTRTAERAHCPSCPMADVPHPADGRGCTRCELSGTGPGEPTWSTASPATADTVTPRSLRLAAGSAASSIGARERRRAAGGADHGPPRYLRFAVLLI